MTASVRLRRRPPQAPASDREMMPHWSMVALVVALALAVGCKASRRSVAPVPEHGATPTTSPVLSGTCGDGNAPLREAQGRLRRALELTKTVSADDARRAERR